MHHGRPPSGRTVKISVRRERPKSMIHHGTLAILFLAWSMISSGCAPVGPDYVPPENTPPATWHTELRKGLSAESTDPRQLASWWSKLNDPILTKLIDEAVTGNLDLKQVKARIREARARRGISKAGLLPSVDASGTVSRSKSSANSGSDATRSFYSVGFDAGWEVDIFGGVRRSVEAAEADLAASRESMRDVMVSLVAEIALNYLDVRTKQKRLEVAENNLAIQQEAHDFIDWRYQAGLSNLLELQQAQYNLENTSAQIPNLRSGMEEAKNRLAVLIGSTPGSVHKLLEEPRSIPELPPSIAVGVPAETLRQRPDIRNAERSLAAQTARIGVAAADLYPKFRLSGSIGLESLKSADLFSSESNTWSILPGVSWNIFDAGAIRRNIEVQSAVQEQLLINYEATILGALEEVENALSTYAEEQIRREHLSAAVEAARQAEKLAGHQYLAGLVDFNTVLDAQRSLLSFEDQLAQSDGTVTANLVRLYKALGGGWNSPANH